MISPAGSREPAQTNEVDADEAPEVELEGGVFGSTTQMCAQFQESFGAPSSPFIVLMYMFLARKCYF